jgi:hypothetical protein
MRLFKRLYDGPAFKRATPAPNALAVIQWWESRRIFFNLAVGCTGLVACTLMIVCAFVSDSMVGETIGLPDGPLLGLFAIFLYGILANLFYTSGWICELLLRANASAEKSAAAGIQAFRAGVTFSVILTFSPAILCWIVFGMALAHGQTHGPPPE